ncbi:uncharacterized protein LOC113774250 [Coffea eugenioides]|uniref:uncharacterized protein LOC113774250 n=1 Tax=Coffea eugenioides TaxID=49369 RepID=UPI000F60568A|nr:uncharacterized protein LOC113774250 [Coffea eugenioides]
MAANGQQFGERQDYDPRKVNEVQQAKTCGIRYASSHHTDMCPTLQDDPNEYVNAVGRFPGPPQMRYDPYSNTYNPRWKDHPNFSYAPRPPGFHQQQYQPRLANSQQQPVSKSGTSLEEIVKSLATNAQQFQQEMRTSIQNLENQLGQLAAAFNRWESQDLGKLPSQTIINPKQNVTAITLKNDKELPQPSQRISEQAIEEAIEKKEVAPKPKDVPQQKFRDESSVVVTPPPPFPSRFAKSKKQEQEVFDIFRKGEKLPPKYKDPGIFTVPCKIGNVKVEKVLVDLGAAINIMPRSIYNSLNLGPLEETSVIMQLADRSNAYPDGVLEDILVQVDKLVFPADFYVLDRDDDFSVSPPILLGRPFLITSKTKIDVYSGTLTMEFDGEIIKFNICDPIKCSSEAHSVFVIDVIDPFIQQKFELNGRDTLKVVINRNLDSPEMSRGAKKFELHPD